MSNKDINRKHRVLITDDDNDARLVLRMMVERAGYEVFEADDGQVAVNTFQDIQPDVVLMDAMMPNVDGFTAVERIRELPYSEDVPIVMITALSDDESIERAFKAGATDYITKPIIISVLRHRLNRLIRTKMAEERLYQVIDDQKVLHRIDRELGYTLNLDRVLNLAMDSAMRRTGASSCVIGWINKRTQKMERLASIGGSALLKEPVALSELKSSDHKWAPLFETDPSVQEFTVNDMYTRIILPLVVDNETSGFIILERVLTGFYVQEDLDFLTHLASRTAAGINKAQSYNRSREYNEQMSRLHTINNAISSNLESEEIYQAGSRGITTLLNGSSGLYVHYNPKLHQFEVKSTFVVEGLDDELPEVGTKYKFTNQDKLRSIFFNGPVQFQTENKAVENDVKSFSEQFGLNSGLMVPLIFEDKLRGLLIVGESRYTRYYIQDDISLAENLAIHIATIDKQADLFSEIKELEEVKSEMIRMASHDLKNPLLQVGGYLDLLIKTLEESLNEDQQDFVGRIESGIEKMNNLLEDILNLEKVESHRTSELDPIDIRQIMVEVVAALQTQADLKSQTYIYDIPDESVKLVGNGIQIQQAFTNFVGNAIKYTPENGAIEIKAEIIDDQFRFQVQDSGFGIPKDRQDKLFQRFYRARTPGTEEIPGTGLGLSLVKTVIERHGGEVWFESEESKGSTFGFWLPAFEIVSPN